VHDPCLYAVVLLVHNVQSWNPVGNYREAGEDSVARARGPDRRRLVVKKSGRGGPNFVDMKRVETVIGKD